MNIDKKIKKVKEEFNSIQKDKAKLQKKVQEINQKLIELRGQYKILKEIKDEDKNNK